MSRVDRMVTRRQEAPRKVRKSQKLRAITVNGKVEHVRPPHHIQGDGWWRKRFADVVERRDGRGSHTPIAKRASPTPRSLPAPVFDARPKDMTRQAHRRLYRMACKLAGVAYVPGHKRTASAEKA